MTPHSRWVSVSFNQRTIVFHRVELTNLSIKICALLRCFQNCIAALFGNLINRVTDIISGRIVTHESVNVVCVVSVT